MDNEFADLEAELLRLQPRRPDERLAARLADELDRRATVNPEPARPLVVERRDTPPRRYRTATTWSGDKWANWTVAAALVALMLMLDHLVPARRAATDASPLTLAAESAPELRPVKAGRLLLGSRQEGVVELADGTAVQRVRDYFVDTIEWRDPRGNAQLRWEVPREAVRYVGLAAY